jgi:SAM-dependent methyltransferase
MSNAAWWESFFDADYLRLWSAFVTPERTAREVDGLWALLNLKPGSRVLDAPCGFGRIARALAERGAEVLGVDASPVQIERAESERGEIPRERLRYLLHDVRNPLGETGFDAAINVFSSIGYGSDDDDLAAFQRMKNAVRPGGLVLIETLHRDALSASLARGGHPGMRLPDGTLLVEVQSFDAIAGRMNTVWHWSGPAGSGQKAASIRIYSITEIVRMLERAGLRFRSAHAGCSTDPFRAEGPAMGGRAGLLAERVD